MIRVHFPEGVDFRDFDANKIDIAADGSLLLSKVTQKEGPFRNNPQTGTLQRTLEVEQALVRAIRRDLWAEVEAIADDEPAVLLGEPGALSGVH